MRNVVGRRPRDSWYADPTSANPAAVADLFAEALDVPTVDPDDDFFRLGGDSLLAETLLTTVERDFGAFLSASALLDAPTPRALAALVARQLRHGVSRCLMPIRPEGNGPPLFCLHGMNGHITYGQSMVTVFGIERPIFAIRARGLRAGEKTTASVEACAADYIREIRRVRPRGPYLLMAPCGPSIIAYEMAQQLTRAGEEVPGIALADPAVTDNAVWLRQSGLARSLVQHRASRNLDRLRPAGTPALSGPARAEAVLVALARAIRTYTPVPYSGRMLLLYSQEWSAGLLDPRHGFPSLVRDLRAIEVAPTHNDLQVDFRSRPAAAIRDFLQEVAPV